MNIIRLRRIVRLRRIKGSGGKRGVVENMGLAGKNGVYKTRGSCGKHGVWKINRGPGGKHGVWWKTLVENTRSGEMQGV